MKVFIKKKFGIHAVGEFDVETKGIVVKKGSSVCQKFTEKYYNDKFMKIRKEVLDNTTLTKDVSFNSPSSAACFVLGRSANGWAEWVDEGGQKIQTYR